eukprot:CAMPEP_0175726924 /NCGR_PEP_ID=MMETSP0097-20121207/48516_1 /TAXON_ID=311494 /ORGANISM="Alexandrium monilatum, Strain CCMP3105" /LENGTH=514 /DNA_ID=CAMNT_0017034725 /DNA_START=83 /DNA_END=1624 /DNA_ORIENTATION=-
MVFGNYTQVPHPNVSLAANPDLYGLTPLQVFDATVYALTAAGVMVILNNHVSSTGWCCTLTDGEGLWYTSVYSQDAWLRGVRVMAARYSHDPLVVGFDLRNEIRPSVLGNPVWGSGENTTDWSMAAVKAAQEVLQVNHNMLIIISGLYFSIFLCDVPRRPVHELVPSMRGRTIYTSHEYKWVNFHLVGRAALGGYMLTLAVWWIGIWVLAALGWRLGNSRCLAGDHSCCERCTDRAVCCCRTCLAPCGCRPGRVQRSCELLVAAVTTAASIAVMCVTELFMDKCGLWHIVLSMLFPFVAFVFSLVSLVLWMRLAVACVQQSQEQLGWPAPDVPTVQELALRMQSGRHRDLSFVGAGSRGQSEDSPPRRQTFGPLRVLARSKRCLAFTVSLLLLCALGVVRMLYGRYEFFASELDSRWGFLVQGKPLDDSESAVEAPVWIGEFGSNTEDLWWGHILRYVTEREIVGWAYWSLNGEKTNGHSESFGLLMEDSATVRHPWKLQALQRLIRTAEPLRA